MNGPGIAVLGVLDEEYHEECNNCRASIDNQLPGIRVMEDGAGETPGDDDTNRSHKGPAGAKVLRPSGGELAELVGTSGQYCYSGSGRFLSRFFKNFQGHFGCSHGGSGYSPEIWCILLYSSATRYRR